MTATQKEEHRSGDGATSKGGGSAEAASAGDGGVTAKMKGRGRGRGTDQEERKAGSVDRFVWEQYVRALGGTWRLVATTVLLAAAQGLTTGGDWWVSVWSEQKPVGAMANVRYEVVFIALIVRPAPRMTTKMQASPLTLLDLPLPHSGP